MNNPFNYTKRDLTQIFSEVNTLFYDKIDEGIMDYALKGLKNFLEGAMKAELKGYLKAVRYKHQDMAERIDYRNGYYHRNLVTSFGALPLKVVYEYNHFRPQSQWVNEH